MVEAAAIEEGEEVFALERGALTPVGQVSALESWTLALHEGEGVVSVSRDPLEEDPNEGWGTAPAGRPPRPVHAFPTWSP